MLMIDRPELLQLYILCRIAAQASIPQGLATAQAGSAIPVYGIAMQADDPRQCCHISPTQMVAPDGRVLSCGILDEASRVLLMVLQNPNERIEASHLATIGMLADAFGIGHSNTHSGPAHFYLKLGPDEASLLGVRIHSPLCSATQSLLGGGRVANIKYEQTSVRLSQPAVHKVNRSDSPDCPQQVARRILYIQGLGGHFKYADVADRIFRSNLLMLDTNMPRIVASMLWALHLDNLSRMPELIAMLEQSNPLKLKSELVEKHGFYAHKVRQLLLAAAWGMSPTKVYNGLPSALGGHITIDAQGHPLLFTRAQEHQLGLYLSTHALLEKGNPEADKYGQLERENGLYYLKLNLSVRWS